MLTLKLKLTSVYVSLNYAEAFNLLQFDEKANYLFIFKFPIPSVQNKQKLILLAQQIQNTRELKMVFGFA